MRHETIDEKLNERRPNRANRVIAGAFAASVAVTALFGCSTKTTSAAKKQTRIEACPTGWASSANEVGDVTEAHGEMQAGVAELISDLSESGKGHTGNGLIPNQFVPPKLEGAAQASLDRYTRAGVVFYGLVNSEMSNLSTEFCSSDGNLHETPAYIGAAAALETAGIKVSQEK